MTKKKNRGKKTSPNVESKKIDDQLTGSYSKFPMLENNIGLIGESKAQEDEEFFDPEVVDSSNLPTFVFPENSFEVKDDIRGISESLKQQSLFIFDQRNSDKEPLESFENQIDNLVPQAKDNLEQTVESTSETDLTEKIAIEDKSFSTECQEKDQEDDDFDEFVEAKITLSYTPIQTAPITVEGLIQMIADTRSDEIKEIMEAEELKPMNLDQIRLESDRLFDGARKEARAKMRFDFTKSEFRQRLVNMTL